MIEACDQWIDRPFQIGEVDQPSDLGINRSAYGDLATKRVPMHAAALVTFGHIGQIMGGLESEVFYQLNDVRHGIHRWTAFCSLE